jgi:hypothetical protein
VDLFELSLEPFDFFTLDRIEMKVIASSHRVWLTPHFSCYFLFCQVMIYSLEKYDEKFLTPELHSAIGAENVRSVRVSLSLDTADLAKG